MNDMNSKPLSLYIHYPFCKSKCPYCDFNSHVSDKIDQDGFLRGYLNELRHFAPSLQNRNIKTIFFGGGTPSLMPTYFVEKILEEVSKIWNIDENCEITLEANPTSFEAEKFKDFKSSGINRLSIGIQSLNDTDLKFLGREHSASEAIKTIQTASQIFENYSFDLIYGRPNQNLESWEKELKRAIDLSANHLSLYQLTIEKGTPFYRQYLNKEFILPDEDLAADLYQMTNEITARNGLELYEISNYAKSGWQSRHNLAYWKSEDYLGIGAGAHSRVYFDGEKARRELMMFHQPDSWLKKSLENGAAIQTNQTIDPDELLEEVVLMGLRLKEGIRNSVFQKHFGKNIDDIFDVEKLNDLIKNEMIFIDSDVIKITPNNLVLTNGIIKRVLRSVLNFDVVN
ncbi:MAG: oxygen-independent coproporphyrinogen-3 oxidase [Rickettsiales bacterium]|jgi:oxygen-independent coproporphyrinogen-3 oxidase